MPLGFWAGLILLNWVTVDFRTYPGSMRYQVAVLVIVLISACSADRLACPDIPNDKLKLTVIRPGQLKKKNQEDKFEASTRYRPSDFKPRTDLKKAESIEEWDCPEARKIEKLARAQKRRMEKQLRLEQKRRREIDTLTVIPLTLRYSKDNR